MRILITGGAGFIGSHLAYTLLDKGHEVVGIDDLSTGRLSNWPERARLITADIGDGIADVWNADEQFDVIYHCAASYRDREAWKLDVETNVLGTIATVRAAQAWKARLIYFQTSLCYGPKPRSPVDPAQWTNPVGSYAVSKTAAENYIRDSGIDYVSLRLANIYGPRNLSGPVPTFFKRISEGQPCTIVDSRRDFIYIGDLVNLAVKALTQGRGVYHASSGRDYSILELYTAVHKAMGEPEATYTIVPRGPDDVATLLLDPIDTFGEFGWRATTPLVAGIMHAVQWYQQHPVTETYTHLAMKG